MPEGITFQLWRPLTVKPIKSHFKAPTYFDAGGKCNLGPLKITQRKTWRASLNKLGSAKSHTLHRQIWISTKTVAIQLLRSGESVRVWLLYSFFFYYYTPADICRVATITFILYEKILHNNSVARSVKKIPHLWRIQTTFVCLDILTRRDYQTIKHYFKAQSVQIILLPVWDNTVC